jgi:hypothetical protein
MAQAKTKKKRSKSGRVKARPSQELDSVYLLKLVLYLIVGSQWLRLTTNSGNSIPIPIGLLVGLAFAMHDHFQIDRKVEYALILVAMLIGFFAQTGFYLSI